MKIEIRLRQNGKTFEGEAVLNEVHSSAATPTAGRTPAKETHPTKPSEALQALYQAGYFATERTLATVTSEFSKLGYNFNASSVVMALGSKKYLQRRGSRGSYRFVQRYPPNEG